MLNYRLEPASDQLTVALRTAPDGDLLFIAHEGTEPFQGVVSVAGEYEVTAWDMAAGQIDELDYEVVNGQTRIPIHMLGGSALCFGLEGGGGR